VASLLIDLFHRIVFSCIIFVGPLVFGIWLCSSVCWLLVVLVQVEVALASDRGAWAWVCQRLGKIYRGGIPANWSFVNSVPSPGRPQDCSNQHTTGKQPSLSSLLLPLPLAVALSIREICFVG